MGNWHCVPSSCATVEYREYEGAKVRWRYIPEPWQEIIGDDYTLEQVPLFIPGGECSIRYTAYCVWDGIDKVQVSLEGPVTSISCSVGGPSLNSYSIVAKNAQGQTLQGNNFNISVVDRFNYQTRIRPRETPKPGDCLDNEEPCIFKIFNKGQLVYTQTRDICPIVEKIPCKLSDEIKQIEIDKLPYLERVEIIPWAYQNFGLNVYRANIPPYCLNIYKNTSATIIPLPGGIPTPSNTSDNNYKFLTQICSSPDCLPPEYQVICDCRGVCESCPDGTCPIQCGDHVCCYNDYGVSILEIPLADYCGGNS